MDKLLLDNLNRMDNPRAVVVYNAIKLLDYDIWNGYVESVAEKVILAKRNNKSVIAAVKGVTLNFNTVYLTKAFLIFRAGFSLFTEKDWKDYCNGL